jgi:hypothetical protein
MKDRSFFWPSFTDLMTSLFFIVLVLYILSYLLLDEQKKASEEQLKVIKEIENSVRDLPASFFQFDATYKRYALRREIRFERMESKIPAADTAYIKDVGLSIKQFIDSLGYKYADQDIKFLLIIEGMASKDKYFRNYELSFERSLAIKKLWDQKGIIFDPQVCDIQVSGSGIYGLGRSLNESESQRTLIHIVPKIGNFIADERL